MAAWMDRGAGLIHTGTGGPEGWARAGDAVAADCPRFAKGQRRRWLSSVAVTAQASCR